MSTLLEVEPMAKRTDAKPPPEPLSGGRRQTTVRIYADTAKKLTDLAALRGLTSHDLLDVLLSDRLSHDLIEAAEARAAELRKQQGK